ncbi:hypothetical protein CCMA1212_001407 [Trichoderma ghanense]|uniref:Uncharacterized protein n=1 Tax=Trichoderma ghanense TaxID=65468 RepID=A0ABY2HGX8_9HYPO
MAARPQVASTVAGNALHAAVSAKHQLSLKPWPCPQALSAVPSPEASQPMPWPVQCTHERAELSVDLLLGVVPHATSCRLMLERSESIRGPRVKVKDGGKTPMLRGGVETAGLPIADLVSKPFAPAEDWTEVLTTDDAAL